VAGGVVAVCGARVISRDTPEVTAPSMMRRSTTMKTICTVVETIASAERARKSLSVIR
jgi:hypothetical protein